MAKQIDNLDDVAREICELWSDCGGFGPPHQFNVSRWARGTAKITYTHGLSPDQWREAHQLAVELGARRGGGAVP